MPKRLTTLDVLITKRDALLNKLQRFRTFVEEYDSSNISELQSRFERFSSFLREYEEIQDKMCETGNIGEDVSEFFENEYFDLKRKAEELLGKQQPTSGSESAFKEPTQFLETTERLPVINLPPFSGNYEDFISFEQTFTSLILENKRLGNLQRFHYLKSCLKGPALSTINSLQVTADNFPEAWDLIVNRFKNQRLIVNKHVHALFNLPNVAKESAQSLRSLLDSVNENLRALKVLKEPVDQWSTLLVYLVSNKLDQETLKQWESSRMDAKSVPMFKELGTFLELRCSTLESIEAIDKTQLQSKKEKFKHPNQSSPPARNPTIFRRPINSAPSSTSSKFTPSCFFCSEQHYLYQCSQFRQLSVAKRAEFVDKNKICRNCLRSKNHTAEKCFANSCQLCSLKHNTLIHPDNSVINTQSSTAASTTCNNATSTPALPDCSQVLLSTAVVTILDKFGNTFHARALLDSGSEASFITKSLSQTLRLPTKSSTTTIYGVSAQPTKSTASVSATIQSRLNQFTTTTEFIVLPKITSDIPAMPVKLSQLKLSKPIELADPQFSQPGKIDLLLGTKVFWNCLSIGQLKPLGEGGPVFQKTLFGWIVAGSVPNGPSPPSITTSQTCTALTDNDLLKFWEVEDCPNTEPNSKDNQDCEHHFSQTHKRDKDGRFIVELPFNEKATCLGDTKGIAEKRFHQLERRLNKDSNLRHDYVQFMTEYEDLGHMELVPENEINANPTFYLPHHPVFKGDSTTTKTRVVFNASQQPSDPSTYSLNDVLQVGPVIQQDLTSILIRFRTRRIAMTADIAKMYRQVRLSANQTDLHRIFWRADPSEPLKNYRLTTLTYGTAPASFIATRCIKQLADEARITYPSAAAVLERDFYMDDLLTCVDTPDEARELQHQLIYILKQGGFELRKWTSNVSEILQGLPTELRASNIEFTANTTTEPAVKTLGLIWTPSEDTFKYKINPTPQNEVVTKRKILSEIARIFDPLGLVGPVILQAKIFMQRLWQLNLAWDESVPADIFTSWTLFRNEFEFLNQLRIDRYALLESPAEVELHGFCDASQRAYGAVVYLRSVNAFGEVFTQTLCSKSRVAPAKKDPKNDDKILTIAKLELCGAVLLSKLVKKAISISNLNYKDVYMWTDSTIVLHWINSPASKWKQFVSNRVKQIQNDTANCIWGHVPTKDNPADQLSRGVSPRGLISSTLWWKGPTWLSLGQDQWPPAFNEVTHLEEKKHSLKSMPVSTTSLRIIDVHRYSKLTKLKRTTAYVFRYIYNLRNNNQGLTGPLSAEELHNALSYLIRTEQRIFFPQDVQNLNKGLPVSHKSPMRDLNPFIDDKGLLRVGGRLKNSNLDFSVKHPLILPYESHLSALITEYEHIRNAHCGPTALLYSIRQKYWPLKGKQLAKKIVRACKPCFMSRPIVAQQLMGQLPAARLESNNVFNRTGVDYCGPVYIKNAIKGRNTQRVKAYIAIFVCLSTKAVHIELVTDLTTASFLGALKRFIARRGLCAHIYSDRGTNFVGANQELRKLHRLIESEDVQGYLSGSHITWHFVPPRAPNFGGLWEAAVKSCKTHLRRTLGDNAYPFDQLYTYLTLVEACLNSRPLTPLSSHPDDLSPLTPGHFLIGRPLTALPSPDLTTTPVNRLDKWRLVQRLAQTFWSRWSHDYLNTLQQRGKWRRSCQPLEPGQLVVIKEDAVPMAKWKMARVVTLHPGPDDLPRVATLRTSDGTLMRPISKICPLPLQDPPARGEDVGARAPPPLTSATCCPSPTYP